MSGGFGAARRFFETVSGHIRSLSKILPLLALLGVLPESGLAAGSVTLKLQKGDRIVFFGNTFAERLALFSYFETLLASRYPDHDLTFRNLGWSADTLTLQPRPLNFGDMFTHLSGQKADVIFACFGMNEAFEGPAGLHAFESAWRNLLDRFRASKFNGRAPGLVLVSPIAHEKLGGHLPDPTEHNRNLAQYTRTMENVAAEYETVFIDLFTPTHRLMEDESIPDLTFNGIHLTRYGDWVVAHLMARALEAGEQSGQIVIDAKGKEQPLEAVLGSFPLGPSPPGPPPRAGVSKGPLLVVRNLKPGRYSLKRGNRVLITAPAREWERGVPISGESDQAEALRQMIVEKNQHFFYRWRPVNGEYVYGRRAEPFGVISFPPEMKELDEIVAELDRKIWQMSKSLRAEKYQLVKDE